MIIPGLSLLFSESFSREKVQSTEIFSHGPPLNCVRLAPRHLEDSKLSGPQLGTPYLVMDTPHRSITRSLQLGAAPPFAEAAQRVSQNRKFTDVIKTPF